MPKFLKHISFFALLLFLVGCFSGCLFTLSAPTLSISGNVLTWAKDGNASKYELVLNERTITTTENSVNVAYYVEDGGEQNVKIRAFSKNMFYNNSDYSPNFTFNVASSKLLNPTNVKVDVDAKHNYVASWNGVSGAEGYVLKLVNNTTKKITYLEVNSETTSKNITQDLSQTGTFVLFVRAITSDVSIMAPSAYVGSDEFEWLTYINTPVVSLSGGVLSWPSVDGAKSYVVATQEGKSKEVLTNSLPISSSGLLSTGNFTTFFVQALAQDGRGYDSVYSDGVAYVNNTSSEQLQNTKLEYMNKSFDLRADSQEELECITFYSMFYRIKDINFAMNIPGVQQKDYSSAIKNKLSSYTEIMSIGYSLSSMGNLVNLKISFGHPNTPTLTAEGEKTVSQNSKIEPLSYTNSPRENDFDDFLINTREKSLTVFNSDQLYVALQNGYKPVFTSNTSPARTVYELAKDVLREIVDDSMTEFQKTNAIYDWLSYKVKYDYNLLAYTEKLESEDRDGSQAELSKYKGFYIEGVMLDGGQAVCDGISKTFVLLTSIENITCCKVSGLASGGNHAWNKIALDLNSDTVKEWYTVDVTWGDVTQISGDEKNYVEFLSHSYYLLTDEVIELNKHQESNKDYSKNSETAFSYYQNVFLTDGINTQSLYITSNAELSNLMAIVSNLGLSGIEFAVAPDAFVSVNGYTMSYNILSETLKLSPYASLTIYACSRR